MILVTFTGGILALLRSYFKSGLNVASQARLDVTVVATFVVRVTAQQKEAVVQIGGFVSWRRRIFATA